MGLWVAIGVAAVVILVGFVLFWNMGTQPHPTPGGFGLGMPTPPKILVMANEPKCGHLGFILSTDNYPNGAPQQVQARILCQGQTSPLMFMCQLAPNCGVLVTNICYVSSLNYTGLSVPAGTPCTITIGSNSSSFNWPQLPSHPCQDDPCLNS
jgi:hypothetical protein